MPTQEEYNIHQTSTRELYVKIDLLDFITENKIGEIQGNVIDGNINIDAFSNIRRTCDITLIVTDSSFLISESSKIWLNKKIRINIGLKNQIAGNIVWFNKGIYVINEPTLSYSTSTKQLSMNCSDLMCLLDSTIMGQLQYATQIPIGTNISSAIYTTANTLGGVNKLLIDSLTVTTPYLIKKTADENVFSVLQELNNLYMNWEIFFDENGYLIFQQIKNRLNDPIIYDFNVNKNLTINYAVNPDFKNVKNRIVVWGRQLDTGVQIHSILDNTNVNSPFNTTKISIRPLVITDDKIYTQDQADTRANYELFKHSNFNEKINISCVPIYFLDVNKIVNFNVAEINLIGKYLVTKISLSLKHDTLMTVEAYKIY